MDKEGNKRAAAESNDDIVDETIPMSPMKNRTRSKSSRVVLPEEIMCPEPVDEPPRPQPSKRHRASPALLRAGGQAKYFQHNPNQFPSIASTKLTQPYSPQGKGRRLWKEVTNSRPHVRSRLVLDDEIEFSFASH